MNQESTVGDPELRDAERQIIRSMTPDQRIRYLILCAKAIADYAPWTYWANAWLDKTDRTYKSAREAERAVQATRLIEAPLLAEASYLAWASTGGTAPSWQIYAAVTRVRWFMEEHRKAFDLLKLAQRAILEEAAV